MPRSRSLLLFGTILGFGLGACGSDSSSSSSTTTMTADEASSVGEVSGSLVAGAAGSLALFTIDDGTLTDPSLSPSVAARRKLPILMALRAGSRLHPEMGPRVQATGILDDCDPTLSNTTDTDADGIYDDATATFTAGNCSYTNDAGETVSVTGSIRVRDQGAIHGFLINFNTLRYNFTGLSSTGDLTLTGSYSTNVGANLATAGENLHVTFNSSVDPTIDVSEAWTLTFTPTGTIETGATHLPAGSFTIAGSFSINRADRHWALILVSTDPLVYDGACADRPPFDSGTLEGQIAGARSHGFEIIFNGCGTTPTISALGATT